MESCGYFSAVITLKVLLFCRSPMMFSPSCGMKAQDPGMMDEGSPSMPKHELENGIETAKSDSEGCREADTNGETAMDERMKLADGERVPESQSEDKFYIWSRKRPASDDQNREADSYRSLEHYPVRAGQARNPSEDRFTYFGKFYSLSFC